MKSKKKNMSKPSPQDLQDTAMPQQSGKDLIVPYTDVPVQRSATKQIHPRPVPPPVPKGEFTPDADSSPSLELD